MADTDTHLPLELEERRAETRCRYCWRVLVRLHPDGNFTVSGRTDTDVMVDLEGGVSVANVLAARCLRWPCRLRSFLEGFGWWPR